MPQKEIIQVAAYLFGRIHHAIDIEVGVVVERREHFRQHRHLYRARDMQLAFQAFVFFCGNTESLAVASGIPYNEEEHRKTNHH